MVAFAAAISVVWASGAEEPAAIPIDTVIELEAFGQLEEDVNDGPQGFYVPTLEEDITELLRRYADHVEGERWESAFAVMDEVSREDVSGLIPLQDGWYLPASGFVASMVRELPASGRDAYRLYFDGSAQRLWDSIEADPLGPMAITNLRRVSEQYFLTSVGDDATDRLADLAWQAGRFDEAERLWRSILDYHPSSNLAEIRLQFKRLSALARAGRTERFEAVSQTLRRRFGGEAIIVGGETQSLSDAIDGLANAMTHAEAIPTPKPDSLLASLPVGALTPPEGAEPIWAMNYLSYRRQQRLRDQIENWYELGTAFSRFVPPVVIHEDRVYCNWLGMVFATDLNTGKLLWRTPDESFEAVIEATRNFDAFRRGRMELTDYTLTVAPGIGTSSSNAGGGLLLVGLTPYENMDRQPGRQLLALDLETGAKRWDTTEIDGLDAEWKPVGNAAVVGPRVLVPMTRGSSTETALVALDATDGSLLWSLSLGSAVAVQNRSYEPSVQAMTLDVHDGLAYLLTNNGALLCVDPQAQRLQWALTYEPPVGTGQGNNRFNVRVANQAHARLGQGQMIFEDNRLLFKEPDNPRLFAIDTKTREILWSRETDPSAELVASDERHAYVLHGFLDAFDLRNQRLRPEQVRFNASRGDVLVTGGSVLVFAEGKIFEVDKASFDRAGDPVPTYDHQSSGGSIMLAGDRLILVSNLGITAYDVSHATTPVSLRAPAVDTSSNALIAVRGAAILPIETTVPTAPRRFANPNSNPTANPNAIRESKPVGAGIRAWQAVRADVDAGRSTSRSAGTDDDLSAIVHAVAPSDHSAHSAFEGPLP